MKIHKRYINGKGADIVSSLPTVSRKIKPDQPTELTVIQARKELHSHLHLGMRCPVCDRFTKKYQRTITTTMAKGLLILYNKTGCGDGFIHLAELFADQSDPTKFRGDFAKLRYWNLVEESSDSKGMWRITPDGISFLREEIDVPRYVYIYNHAVDACSNERVTFNDCLKEDDLSKLLTPKPQKTFGFVDVLELLFGKDVAPDGTTGI
jgi:hypothetical protein